MAVDDAVRYFGVTNLGKHQHYKDRRPPWVKLHRTVFSDYAFSRLQGASKAHLMLLWLLASEYENRMPYDPEWVGRKLDAQEPVDLDVLVSAGFLTVYQDASAPLAECAESARSENREQSTERAVVVVPREGDFVTRLTVAINHGVRDNPRWAAPVIPIRAQSGAGQEVAAAIMAAGVEEDFACRAAYTVVKQSKSDRPPTSHRYVQRAVLDAWQGEQASRTAATATTPAELPAVKGFTRAGEIDVLAGIDAWKRQQAAKERA